MIRNSQRSTTSDIKPRAKCIIIEDSYKKYHGSFTKKSSIITPRNPFKRDTELIDYDMDSEDEWAEENGEDLDKKDAENEDDEEMNSEEEEGKEGFIVSDGHLSVAEYDFDDENQTDEKQKIMDIQQRRERQKNQKGQQALGGKVYAVTQDSEGSELLQEYAIIPLSGLSFPLSLTKPEKIYETG